MESIDLENSTLLSIAETHMAKLHSIWADRASMQPSGYPYNYQDLSSKSVPLIESFERLKDRNVMDIGCNTGLYSLLVAHVANSVDAYDIDAELIYRADQAKQYFESNIFSVHNLSFHDGNFADYLTKDIDAVVAACVLYHIGDQNLVALKEFILAQTDFRLIIQARPARDREFAKHPEWGSVSRTTMYGGIYTVESNLEFIRDCGFDRVTVIGLNASKFHSEFFPVVIAEKG